MKDKYKPKLVVLSGAGISAESGLKTFRDSGGLWEGYNVYDVATPEAWKKNPALVQEFYNMRRKEILLAEPNEAHKLLAKLEGSFDVSIITQNIDNLHERAGSSNVLHLHGIITKAQSSLNANLVYDIDGWQLSMDATCELGSPLRPHVVWFGESVPNIVHAANITALADVFLVIGTSLQVYPASGLLNHVLPEVPIYLIDPNPAQSHLGSNITVLKYKAAEGMQKFTELMSGLLE